MALPLVSYLKVMKFLILQRFLFLWLVLEQYLLENLETYRFHGTFLVLEVSLLLVLTLLSRPVLDQSWR